MIEDSAMPQVPCYACCTSNRPVDLCEKHLAELPNDYRSVQNTNARLVAIRVVESIRQNVAQEKLHRWIRESTHA